MINVYGVLAAAVNVPSSEVDAMFTGLEETQKLCHALARHSGWWDEYDSMPEQYRKYFLGTKIALIHSETSEMLEGNRKGKKDDHLPHRSAEEVEAADLIIRLLDYAGALKLDVAGAVFEKLAYNQQRADHQRDHRAAEGGKKF